ncbi:MAG: aspartate aminotransferase family protein [Betaproteobacteria bacterium]|nr:aspartate aminotransferase family protein [Betaproteobacteria bacterium]
MIDKAFLPDRRGIEIALDQLLAWRERRAATVAELPGSLPELGIGEEAAIAQLAPTVLGYAQRLDARTAFAHMDPPTPWLTWAMTLWNASLNQNLLHPETAPVARDMEAHVVRWLAPYFGMDGGHMVPGSTIGNLTGIWAAREIRGAKVVVASDAAHLSVRKAATLLGMQYRAVETDEQGRMNTGTLGDLAQSCLVLTAGTTSVGAVDPLDASGAAAWTHVDAAWAGPMRLSHRHADALAGIERADSVSVSAHKWLFQPKESALIFFRNTQLAHSAISFEGAYLAEPNIGLLGSHGATAIPLLAMLYAWGRTGIAERIERCMEAAASFAAALRAMPGVDVFDQPTTGVVAWRSQRTSTESLRERLPAGSTSVTLIHGEKWLRNVAANPNVDPIALAERVKEMLDQV